MENTQENIITKSTRWNHAQGNLFRVPILLRLAIMNSINWGGKRVLMDNGKEPKILMDNEKNEEKF